MALIRASSGRPSLRSLALLLSIACDRPGADALPLAVQAAADAPPRIVEVSPLPPGAKPFPQNVADKPVPRVGDRPWKIARDWLAQHERQVESPQRAGAKLVFLGDSIVERWGVSPAYREKIADYEPINLGIAGDYTQNVLWRIDHGALDGLKPDALVLLIGINNLAGGFTPEQTLNGVRAVVDSIEARLPGVPIVLLSLLPARRSASDPLRNKIAEVNRQLAALSGPGVGVHDVGSVLLEPDGSISKAMAPDALHPSAAGYERLTAALVPLLDELVRP